MYPATSLFVAIGQLAIVILVLFSYPLQVHPCRNCLDKVFHPSHLAAYAKPAEEGEEEEIEFEGNEHGHGEMSTFKHVVLTSAIIASGFSIAYFVDDLQLGKCPEVSNIWGFADFAGLVLSFVGATGSTTISFILPGLFYWKASDFWTFTG